MEWWACCSCIYNIRRNWRWRWRYILSTSFSYMPSDCILLSGCIVGEWRSWFLWVLGFWFFSYTLQILNEQLLAHPYWIYFIFKFPFAFAIFTILNQLTPLYNWIYNFLKKTMFVSFNLYPSNYIEYSVLYSNEEEM